MYRVEELPYIEKVKENQLEFGEKVIDLTNKLDTLPHSLMVVMNNESGVNHRAQNPKSSAYGLIQFMKPTIESFGISVENFKKLNNIQQLDYVYKYLKPYRGKIKDTADLYLAVFFPLALYKGEDYIFPHWASRANPIFDLNKDSVLTKAEFRKYVNDKYEKVIPKKTLADFKKKD